MNKGIMIDYQGKQLRATVCEQQIWFSSLDIQSIIDIRGVCLHPEEVADINVDGCLLQMINEFGVYRLSSNDEVFRKWFVCDAILRLRKYGCYKLSIAEEKEKLINEIIKLKNGVGTDGKLKYLSLDKLKAEKSRIEKTFEQQHKEKEMNQMRMEAQKDFPFSYKDLEEDYDVNLAIKNLSWAKANLDEYMVCIGDNEFWFNNKFVQYIKDGDYAW